MEDSRLLNRKVKILWQLENLQNYKGLYGNHLKIFLISNVHKSFILKNIR